VRLVAKQIQGQGGERYGHAMNLHPTPCHRERDDLRDVLLPSLEGTKLHLEDEQNRLRLSSDLPSEWFETTSRPTWTDRADRWWDANFAHVCWGLFIGVSLFALAAMGWAFVTGGHPYGR
jgi:hypothetical protein